MSGKWHVASSLTRPTDTWPLQRGFDAFFGTIIGAGSFYDPEHADARQRQRRARGARTTRLLLHRRDQRPGGRPTSTSTPRAARRHAVLPVRRLHRAALAAARARRGHRQLQGPLRRGLGRGCARRASTGSSTRASCKAHWKLTDARPDPAAVDRGRADKRVAGSCAAWRSMRRRSTAWTRASAASSRRWSATASSTTRWSSSWPTTAPAPRTFPRA